VGLEVKRTLARIYHWEYFWLSVIVIVTLAMHLSIVPLPKDPILDEAHYAGFFGETHEPVSGDAYSIIHNHMDMRPEHPPLAKLFIVGGIYAFGDNQWGWRVPSVIMGTIGIILFFFICRRLKLSRRATNIATFLLGFENFTFVQASVAMLDVFYVTLMLAFFLLYLHRQYLLSGVFIGLSALAKLTGVLGAPALFVHYLFTRTRRSAWFAMTLVMAAVSLFAFLPLFDFAITHQLHNPISRIKEMLSLSGSLTFFNVTHPALSA
jgi:predicted membrane-bound dolichyl-phosphate-mannose-protein mannosyltransferase